MAVPDFQSMMLPQLESLADGKPHSIREVADAVAKKLSVTNGERAERIPSGGQTKFANRIAWVGVHLSFAKLIVRPARGLMQITPRGLEVLKSKPARIDLRFLRQFPEHEEARKRKRESNDDGADAPEKETGSPLETLERSYLELRTALAAELLETIKARPPEFFEKLVLDLMQRIGYGRFVGDAAQHLGGSGDGGVDGLIQEDKLGLDVIYLQAKRWSSPVGASTVREFLGALDQAGAKKGVLITTSSFTKDGKAPFGKTDKKVVLIDGLTLAELMIDHDLGVTPVKTFAVKRIDSDYFEEE